MPGEVFYWIFNMSIMATLTGLLLSILRKFKVIPHRVSVLFWIVPFIRMSVPVGFNSPYCLMALLSRLGTRTVTVYQPVENIGFSMNNYIKAANSYFPNTYKINILGKVFDFAALIWIIGALTITLTLAILYVAAKRKMKNPVRLEKNVFLSERVQSPAVYGIFRPRIVLPLSYKNQELKYILQHEKTHIRRKDNLWRLMGFLAAAIHWFNPFSWIFLKTFLSDLELACDETAISRYSDEERKEYARALLNCSQSKSVFASAFGGAKMRTRVKNIMSYRQMTAFSAVGFTILILAIMYTLLTNAG